MVVLGAGITIVTDSFIGDAITVANRRGAVCGWIARHEILPNALPPVLVEFGLRFCYTFLFISSLSFLGLGIPPPAPTWGSMLSGTGRTYMYLGPWLALAPGLCITAVVYAVNVYGDALRDLLDPRMRGSQ